jgi:hypothetical protein
MNEAYAPVVSLVLLDVLTLLFTGSILCVLGIFGMLGILGIDVDDIQVLAILLLFNLRVHNRLLRPNSGLHLLRFAFVDDPDDSITIRKPHRRDGIAWVMVGKVLNVRLPPTFVDLMLELSA